MPKRNNPQTVTHQAAVLRMTGKTIMGDSTQRGEFLADPAAYLQKAGVAVRGKIELTQRDKDIINMVSDPEVASIYRSGDLPKLSQYLRDQYKSLVNDPSRVAWTVADFEVAVEAVAIAVGVFVAPLPAADDFSEIARVEAVFTARINTLEKTVTDLQAHVTALSQR